MNGEAVRIRRQGSSVILEPLVSDWNWLDEIIGKFSSDFFATGREQPELPTQPELEGAFE